jgi:hypothetical protein
VSQAKYEPLREAERRAAEEREQAESRSPTRPTASSGAEEKDLGRENAIAQDTKQVALRAAWERGQQENAAEKDRAVGRAAYLKEHHPAEYAREQRDAQVKADWQERKSAINQEWALRNGTRAEGQGARSTDERADSTLVKSDTAQSRSGNQWDSQMSDRARTEIREAQAREAMTRERDRSER